MKLRQTKTIFLIMGIIVAFSGLFYVYQSQTNMHAGAYTENNASNISIPYNKTLASSPLNMGWHGKTTFQIDQNATILNVKPGTNITGTISLNVLEKTPIRFYIDDRGFNSTKSILPNGISTQMIVYGKQYQPEFLSQISGPMSSNTTPIPTVIGQASIPYTISVPIDYPLGTYKIKIICESFEPNSINKNLFNMDESEEQEVTLNVQ